MSTIKSSAENLTLNADGANNDIIFQSNGSNVATLDQAGTLTATTFTGASTDATKLPLAGGTMTGQITIEQTSNARALYIEHGATTQDGIQILDMGMTTGKLGYFYSNNADTSTRDLVRIRNDNAAATGTTSLLVEQDSTGLAADFTGTGGIRSAGGIKFGTDTVAANTLDDYEEGTWTPSWVSSGTDPTVSHSPVGTYVKIGNMVFCVVNMGASASASGGSSSNALQIAGLPFACSGDGGTLTTIRAQNWNSGANTPITGYINNGESYIILNRYSSAYLAHTTVKTSDLRTSSDSNQFKASIFYRTT